MKGTDIVQGQEYLFLATESPARQSLIGKRFTVVEIRRVWRRKNRRRVQTMRYFNEDGVGARADELAELDDAKRWGWDCKNCGGTGELNSKPDDLEHDATTCPVCDGVGLVAPDPLDTEPF
jgi:hypothetical protein